MPRIFIAIPISSHLQFCLGRVAAQPEAGVRWVHPKHLHLTLRFLGHITEEQFRRACLAVAQAVEEGPGPFTLSVKGIGAFPSPGHARVVWAGFTGDQEPLFRLHNILASRLHEVGFPPENRSFRPHITLARFRSPASLPPRLNALRDQAFGSWQIDSLHVIESIPHPSGPEYVVRQRYELE